ncbi:hypothetical protein ACRRTK_010215 [Alexandromys fortis]
MWKENCKPTIVKLQFDKGYVGKLYLSGEKVLGKKELNIVSALKIPTAGASAAEEDDGRKGHPLGKAQEVAHTVPQLWFYGLQPSEVQTGKCGYTVECKEKVSLECPG